MSTKYQKWLIASVGTFLALSFCPTQASPAQNVSFMWEPIGAAPTTAGQVEISPNDEVDGAIQIVAPHPSNPNILYIGAVNGGIWRTQNATDNRPSWKPLLDDKTSLSIGALEFDPTDISHQTLVAGFGHCSSFRVGGELQGIIRTTDGGATWIRSQPPQNLGLVNITSIAARGGVVLVGTKVSSDDGDVIHASGIYSVDTRTDKWQLLSGDVSTALPDGDAYDLASNPDSPLIEYTFIAGHGVYRSGDGGAHWNDISTPEIAGLAKTASNARLAATKQKGVFVAIVTGGQLSGLFGSSNSGDKWAALELPSYLELDGHSYGIHVGGQGNSNLSIAGDPNRVGVVYVGGDRQSASNEAATQVGDPPPDGIFPNSLGATSYTGRLFRVDMSAPQGNQATPLTHIGTSNNTAPHADSRSMRTDAAGSIIESDDGGVYRRTLPLGKGDWSSIIGDLQVSEFFSVAWDPIAQLVLAGAQDTGAPEQLSTGSAVWTSLRTGDGGFVAADKGTQPNHSIWYVSSELLEGFSRITYDGQTGNTEDVDLGPATKNADPPLQPQWYSPIVVNAVQQGRLLVAGQNGLYESRYEGDSFSRIGEGIVPTDENANAIAYGGAGNPEAIYVGAYDSTGAPKIYVRTDATHEPSPVTGPPSLTEIKAICLDTTDASIAYLADTTNVFRGSKYGTVWSKITGSLGSLSPGNLTSCAYVRDPHFTGLVIGSSRGTFALSNGPNSVWTRFGEGLPQVIVTHLQYSPDDSLLIAGTLGRGAWVVHLENNGIGAISPEPVGAKQKH